MNGPAHPGDLVSAETAWVTGTLEITLRTAVCLYEAAAREPCEATLSMLLDVIDHASIWAERIRDLAGRQHGPRLHEPLDAVALVARAAAGLADRLAAAEGLGPETRRSAAACSADLDARLAWSRARLRRAERGGRAAALAAVRARLPSRAEFRLERPVPGRPA